MIFLYSRSCTYHWL